MKIKIKEKDLNSAYESWQMSDDIESLANIMKISIKATKKICKSWYEDTSFDEQGIDVEIY